MKERPNCGSSNFASQIFHHFLLKRQFRFLDLQIQFGCLSPSGSRSCLPPGKPMFSATSVPGQGRSRAAPNDLCTWKADPPSRSGSRSCLSPGGLTVVARGPVNGKRHRAGLGSRDRCTASRAGQHACWHRSWHPWPKLNRAGGDQVRPERPQVQQRTRVPARAPRPSPV